MVFEKLKDLLVGRAEAEPKFRQLSTEELRKNIESQKKKLTKEAEKDSRSSLKGASELHDKIIELIEELMEAEPEGEVHARIYKPTSESKRLMLKGVKRASDEIASSPDLEWKNLVDFNRSLRRAVNLLEGALISHGARVATLFEEEVDRLGRLTERLRKVSQDLNGTLRHKKIQIDELDEISSILSTCKDLKNQERKLLERESSLRERSREVKRTLEEERKSLKGLKKSRQFGELEKMKRREEEIEEKKRKIRNSIRANVSQISRPMRKMKRIVQKGNHAVGRDAIEGLNLYMDDPEKAALSEEEGLPKFEALLRGLKGLMGEMNLDRKERQKRSEKIERLLKRGTLAKLRRKFEEAGKSLKELRKEIKSSPLPERKRGLETSIRENENELKALREKLKNTREELDKVRKQAEKKTKELRNLSKAKLKIEIKDL